MMQNYPFWVFDASGLQGNLLFSIFDPTLGFSAVSSPEISIETKAIQPGNWEYKRHVVKTAEVSPMVLSRGARFYDSDFYNWITNAVRGRQPIRRTLILVHFLGFRVNGDGFGAVSFAAINMAKFGFDLLGDNAGQNGVRIPGRAWVLYDCIPTRYKAGGDFDASSGDVSIQEVEIQPEHIAELTISTLSPLGGRAVGLGIGLANAT